MSEEEFLARWSRRKREAREGVAEPAEPREQAAPAAAEAAIEPEFDLSSLPSIDAITAATDVTSFLRKGIPQELTRAALRRAWTADPAIRDFVGLAENAWDFNDPNAMPGFGPLNLSETELGALVERVVGGVRKAAEEITGALAESDNSPRNAEDVALASAPAESDTAAQATAPVASVEAQQPGAAVQQTITERANCEQSAPHRRNHGGALPR